ncbi:hypothetical protein OUZ56_010611 [Daphnia magna]|uniref:Uncharacterized protein n=1 Tax=Daphnia magna TaxID=35525 RepID=A0ABR0AJF0_9CRUS|nr:hypothetical protein OUZ56_010611 [Daphnia magna]
MTERSWWPNKICAGDAPLSWGVFRNSWSPARKSSDDKYPPVFATNSFIVFTAASAWPLLWGLRHRIEVHYPSGIAWARPVRRSCARLPGLLLARWDRVAIGGLLANPIICPRIPAHGGFRAGTSQPKRLQIRMSVADLTSVAPGTGSAASPGTWSSVRRAS